MTKMNKIQALIGVILFSFALNASAVPTLFFDGIFAYDGSTGMLDMDAVLNGYEDIAPAPVLTGSSMEVSAIFSSLGADSDTAKTVGEFVGVLGNDLNIIGGDTTVLLEAELNSLQMRGANGSDFGLMLATFRATGGSLLSSFSRSGLFALELNLSTTFANDMFRSDFVGDLNGNLKSTAVAEPRILAILATGLVFIGLIIRRNDGVI